MIRNRFFIICVLLLSIAVLTSAGYFAVARHALAATGSNSDTVYLYIRPGAGLSEVAREAKQADLVAAPWHLSFGARVLGLSRSLKAGEYEIDVGTTVEELLRKLQSGKTYMRRVSIPEGYSILEVEQVLLDSFGLDTSDMILPSEGSILPETYFYSRGESANKLIDRMKAGMDKTIEAAWAFRREGLPLENEYQVRVLASIVEKETGVPEERPVVAAVFLNRLKKKMRLQSDPTVIYGITGGLPLGRAITRQDLREETAYNTYRIKGLPPTPIANPGKASIKAVLNPASVTYLYFVADGTGGHSFANTLSEHNKNVRAWRKIEAQNSQ
ncbi:MAG: endolytic transglycosylase MltG [Kordiimonas sp.]